MLFIIIERLWKSSHKVCIFWAETVKTCAAASEYISCFLRNVWLLLVVFQCFFNERAAVSEKLFKRKKGASERYQLYIKKEILRRKFAAAYDNLRNILKWKQIKIKTMVTLWKPVTFMYFWLNYCDEKIERIPVAVKNIDHLFNMASEIIEADKLHLFLLSAALELMIMNT